MAALVPAHAVSSTRLQRRDVGAVLVSLCLSETDVTQAQLAEACGVSHVTVHRWLHDPCRPFPAWAIATAPERLRRAIAQRLRRPDAREPVAELPLLSRVVSELAGVGAEYAADLADGTLDREECRRVLAKIREARAVLDDLEVVALGAAS